MPKLFDIKLPGECKSLPDGFWSAVDVWINKPHVVNKRLCGAKVTEVKDVDTEAVRCLLDSSHRDDLLVDSSHRDGLLVDSSHRDEVKDVNTEAVECLLDLDSSHRDELLSFLTGGGPSSAAKESVWSFSVRTFIPKVNCYGPNRQKEMVLKDFDRQQVTFVPFEEDPEGQVSQKKNNVYQIRLLLQACQEHSQEWLLEFHVLRPNEWFSDGVAYPKLPWLSRDLLPKLGRWATESKTSEFKSTLSLLPVEKYSFMYQQLKDQYKNMVKVWPEVTDPEKFVYEDVAIATYLLVLWAEERAEKDLTDKQSFVDLGCGNGLLVHILCNEGHPGKGIDVRKRKIWDMYGPQTILEEKAITPGDGFLFPAADWLIGNHSDELTPWIPIIAARSSYTCRYFVLPCCFFDFYGKYQRRQCKKSQYKEYIDFITEVSQASGFNTEEDCLRIPSTKRVCLVGKSRNYELSKESTAEDTRARYIQSRQTFSGITGQGSNVEGDGGSRHDDTVTDGTSANNWGAGFQPRDRVETVRNCASLPRDFIDGVVLQVANALLGLTTDGEEDTLNVWNQGGSLSVREVAELLQQDTLQVLKKECGGLQTLLKNNHQVFRVEGGMVYIRDWRSPLKKRNARADAKRKPSDPGALKTRYCWFYSHHRQGCPLQAQECAFAHGPDDLRPSTKPLKKMKNSVL